MVGAAPGAIEAGEGIGSQLPMHEKRKALADLLMDPTACEKDQKEAFEEGEGSKRRYLDR